MEQPLPTLWRGGTRNTFKLSPSRSKARERHLEEELIDLRPRLDAEALGAVQLVDDRDHVLRHVRVDGRAYRGGGERVWSAMGCNRPFDQRLQQVPPRDAAGRMMAAAI